MKKNRKVLKRAEDIIVRYHDDNSIYYQELVKSYNEYVNLSNLDKTTNDLYIKHIDSLCNMLIEKKNSKYITFSLIVVLLIMFCLSTYSTINLFMMSNDVNGILNKSKGVLTVNYLNLDNFNALVLSDMDEYMDLKPLTLSLSSNAKSGDMKYNVYIIEDNDGLSDDELLSRDVFLYNVKSKDRDSGIKMLKDSTIKDNRILIYSSSFDATSTDDVEIRMWIDRNSKDYEARTYRFKLYVEGYI